MAAVGPGPAANGKLAATSSSSTLHYSRDAASTSQAPSVLPSPVHAGANRFASQQQGHRRSYDDEDDEGFPEGEPYNGWRRRQSYVNGSIGVQTFGTGAVVTEDALLGQGDVQALGDGTQHWVNKR